MDRPLSVAITSAGQSNTANTGRPIADLRELYTPRALFLVGISAGNCDKFELGDVAIPEAVYYYEPGVQTDEVVKPRPDTLRIHEYLYQNLRYYDPADTDYYSRLAEFVGRSQPRHLPAGMVDRPRPKVESDNVRIASGEKLIRSREFMMELRDRDDRLVTADQESFGFGKMSEGQWWAVFRGISDFGDENKSDDWQYLAAGFAALCLRDFLETEYIAPEQYDF